MPKDQLLSQMLAKTWLRYEKQVHLSRNKASARNVHRLRISTQMLEAVLSLAQGLHATHHSANLISLIKKVRKSLGPLRDVQVEEKSLKIHGQHAATLKTKKFTDFFSSQRIEARKKALSGLEQISLKSEKLRLDRLIEKIKKIEAKKNKKELQAELKSDIKKSLVKLNTKLKNINPERTKEIHRFRIIAKKLRYKGECLNSLTGESHFDLEKLKTVQSVAGRIQNDSVLLKTLDLFLSKKSNQKNYKILKIRKRVANHQAKTISDGFNKLNLLKWEN